MKIGMKGDMGVADKMAFTCGTIFLRERHESKFRKHVVLPNDPLQLTKCHIHVCEVFSWRNGITKEGHIFRPPRFNSVDMVAKSEGLQCSLVDGHC